MIYFVEIGQT